MLLYLTVMLKPLIPIVSDVFSHTFNEMNHIATVHAKYGANHLATQLADTGKDDNGKNQGTTKTLSEVPLHVPVSNTGLAFGSIAEPIIYYFSLLQHLPKVYIFCQGPPPKFFC